MMKSKKTSRDFETLFATVTLQDMTISGHQESEGAIPHLSAQFSAIALDGMFKDRTIELQISRVPDLDPTKKFVGGLITSSRCPSFAVTTDSERFTYMVPLVANNAVKEIYLCFERPRYGKAKVLSWHISTTFEE